MENEIIFENKTKCETHSPHEKCLSLNCFNPQINFPMCTIATMPRLPEHCVEYARILQWPKERPFGGLRQSKCI